MRTNAVLASWWRTKRAMRLSASDLVQLRARKWEALQPAIAATPALAEFAGRPLSDFPITEPAHIRADYGRWNSLGFSHGALTALAEASEADAQSSDVSAGWSSGSGGGSRGLFVATSEERADYLGQSLARLLPTRALLQRQRIALHLRANNALYSDVQSSRIGFRYFALEQEIDGTAEALADYAPTILIAPPHRLLALAKAGVNFPQLRYLFYGSEPMSPKEQALLGKHFGKMPRAIYQASEGFLGAECAHGRLHPNHHAMDIELVPIAGTASHRLIATDLHRRSQPIVRVMLDDVVKIDVRRGGCPCGIAGLAIKPPQGRVQDIWRFARQTVEPSRVVRAVEGPLGARHQWQAVANQQGVALTIEPDAPDKASAKAREALAEATPVTVTLVREPIPQHGPKRRKVVWNDG